MEQEHTCAMEIGDYSNKIFAILWCHSALRAEAEYDVFMCNSLSA